MIIPITHCQQCADMISLFCTEPRICTACSAMTELSDEEIDEEIAQRANMQLNPEKREYTPSEKKSLRTAVHEAAQNDIRAGYSMIRRLRNALVTAEEYTKATFLKELRIELITGEAS